MTHAEIEEADMLAQSNLSQVASGLTESLANSLRLIPDTSVETKPLRIGVGTVFGRSFLGSAATIYASLFRTIASQQAYQAARAARQSAFALRENEWVLQRNLAALEIMQIEKQVLVQDIRIDVATKELENHLQQIENSQATEGSGTPS